MAVRPLSTTSVRTRSEELFERAHQSVAGGDSSNMRVLPYQPPLIIDRGLGCRIWDVDENEYIDLNMAYGPLLYGHRPTFLVDAVTRQLEEKGSQLGFPQELNFLAAEKIKQLFPTIERMRFANSGTEAVSSAVRLARAFTGRRNLIMFEGHYHGWSDTVFNRYHAALDELGDGPVLPAVAGTLGMMSPSDVYLVPWNDTRALENAFQIMHGSVAAVLMEPIMGNACVIPPATGYLAEVRKLTRERGALLIFDEVITGLRVAPGGAQQLYGIAPDVTVLSKALGGGFPIAAFGACSEMMELIASGKVFHGGVYSGNALVLSAANAVLTHVIANQEVMYQALNERSEQLVNGLREIFSRRGIKHVMQHVGPMISAILTSEDVDHLPNYREVRRHSDLERYIQLQHALLDRGVFIHPNQFEPMYLSTAHSKKGIDEVLERFEDAARHAFN